jgi:hypothetical protein
MKKIRFSQGPFRGIHRLQIDQDVRYVLPKDGEPVFQKDGCSVYVQDQAGKTLVIVVQEIPSKN